MKHSIAIVDKVHMFDCPESFVRACMVSAAAGLDHLPKGMVKWMDSIYPSDYTNVPTFWSPYAYCKSGIVMKPWASAGYAYAKRWAHDASPLEIVSPAQWDSGWELMNSLVAPRKGHMGVLPLYLDLLALYAKADYDSQPQCYAIKQRAFASIQSGDMVLDVKKARRYIEQGVIVG